MRIAVVGLGTIAETYITAFRQNTSYDIRYICDTKITPIANTLKTTYKFVTNYREINIEEIDSVFVLTPVESHFDIGCYFLKRHVHVFIEKPLVYTFDQYQTLKAVAKNNQTSFQLLLHWQYGNEVRYLMEHPKLLTDFDEWIMYIDDPYFDDTLQEKAIALGGAWNDSGTNILSFLALFIDIKNLVLQEKQSIYDSNYHIEIEHHRIYVYENKKIVIHIHWNRAKNEKRTIITKQNQRITINHTMQSIDVSQKQIFNGYTPNRLLTQYTALLEAIQASKTNHQLDEIQNNFFK